MLKITASLPRSQFPSFDGSTSMSLVEQTKVQHVSSCQCSTRNPKRTAQWAIDVGHHSRPPLPQTSILTILALGSTITTNLLPMLFRSKTSRERCWARFPACDSMSLQTPTIIPSFLRPVFTCELLLLVLGLVILIHWICIYTLFQAARWRERYLPMTLYAVAASMIPTAYLVGDSATLFLQALPAIWDICAVACLGLDCVLH